MISFGKSLNFTQTTVQLLNISILTERELSEKRAGWWVMLLVAVVIFITVTANLLVILSFVVEPRLRIPFNYYILNLTVSDLLEGAVDMTQLAAGYTYYNYWPYTDAQCTFWLYVDYTLPSVSVWTVVAMTADRMWNVTWPVSYRRQNSVRKCCCAIALTWIVTNIFNLPGFIYARVHIGNQSSLRTCTWDVDDLPSWAWSFWGYTVGNCWVAFTVAIVCYAITLSQIIRAALMARNVGSLSSRRKHRDRQAMLVLTLLILAMLLMWLPWFVHTVRGTLLHIPESELFVDVAFWMSLALSGLNPFLFNAANGDMRRALRKMFSRKNRIGADAVSINVIPAST